MTSATRASASTRALDWLFGKAGTPEDRALAEASRPPRAMQTAFDVLHLASACAVLVTFPWSYGWLPFVDSRIDSLWFSLALGANVLLRFGWERTTAYYRRSARVGEAVKAASTE